MCCVALPCFVCLTLLASFFLPSHLSFKNMYIFLTHALIPCSFMYMYIVYIIQGFFQEFSGGGGQNERKEVVGGQKRLLWAGFISKTTYQWIPRPHPQREKVTLGELSGNEC